MRVDWAAFVSAQDVTQDAPPPHPVHGLLLGNGDIGAAVFGAPEYLRLQIGKNDIWDYRDPVDGLRPPITQQELLEWYAGPGAADASYDPGSHPLAGVVKQLHTEGYRVPMHSAKPAGQIRFRNKAMVGAAYRQRLRLWNAEVATDLGEPRSVSVSTFVPYPRNLVVVHYSPSNKQTFDIELVRHKDSTGTIPNAPEFGASGRDIWLSYRFPADATYPDGFEYVIYGRVTGGTVWSETVESGATVTQEVWKAGRKETPEGWAVAHVEASRPVTLLSAVVTSREAKSPLQRARREVDDAQKAGLSKLRREHQQHWRSFWQRSLLQIEGNGFLTGHWFVSSYHLHCCSRSRKIAPGLYGNWTWQDASPWWGDYHWDYNFEQIFWSAYSSNHLEDAVSYNETVLALLEAAKAEARQVYGLKGAKFFLATYPRKTTRNPYPVVPWDRCMCLSAWAAQEMWWYFLYSQDRRYLREQAYPVLKECARFYEGFLTRAPDEKYDICPTVSPEYWGMTRNFERNGNSLIDLALVKYLMNACAAASEMLGVDKARRGVWLRIAANLREYPTTVTPEGKVFVDVENAPITKYNFPVPVAAVFPGDDIGLHSPEPLQEIARKTAMSIPYNLANDYVALAMARVRLGIDVLEEFERNTRRLRLQNGALLNAGFPEMIWTENFSAPIVLNESVLQSYNGLLRIAPAKLKRRARFVRLRAVGAFLVSGEVRPGGDAAYVAITSEAGLPCLLVRPWQGPIRIRNFATGSQVDFSEDDGVISFKTRKGATYILDEIGAPWESCPLVELGEGAPFIVEGAGGT
jgi:hypothetical protein